MIFTQKHMTCNNFRTSRCVITLIRGLQGDCPCPICLVKRNKQSKIGLKWPLRSAEESMEAVQKYRQLYNKKGQKGKAEEILKNLGLRDVNVSHFPPFAIYVAHRLLL